MLLNVFGQGSQTQNDWRATLRRKKAPRAAN